MLIIKADANALHVLSKKLLDNNGKVLLSPGQSWGRKAGRKFELNGEAIHMRSQDIQRHMIEDATGPLPARIDKLERDAGPALEVKRIRFAMEANNHWATVEDPIPRVSALLA